MEEHIASFPAKVLHCCRKSSKKRYLDQNLNISQINTLYVKKCEDIGMLPFKYEVYRIIFAQFNSEFFQPKKDQCSTCTKYQQMNAEEKETFQHEFDDHLKRKYLARSLRDTDKFACKNNSKVLSFNFDLRAVLSTPKSDAGQVFYKRKLSVYNLCIFYLGDNKGFCNFWDDSQGNRSPNEISTCVYNYLMKCVDIDEVRMMSDGCGGQQKNAVFATMCVEAVTKHPSTQQIDYKFFETGHKQMECDSMHFVIENATKIAAIFVPSEWVTTAKLARKNPEPYHVKRLSFSDFLTFKERRQQRFPRNIKDCHGKLVKWKNVRWLRYNKTNPDCIFSKYNLEEPTPFLCPRGKMQRRNSSSIISSAYSNQLQICYKKAGDILSLCQTSVIPKLSHNFYKTLKSGQTAEAAIVEETD